MSKLDTLWMKGREFLGTKYSIISGAMSWVSESNLVSAVSNAGAFGVLAASAMPIEKLQEEIILTKQKTDKPFGVNLITMNPELDALIELCIDESITHVALAGGIPTKTSIEKLKAANIKVMAFAPNMTLVKRMLSYGADALIIEGTEAGGHIGPVSTTVLVQEILPNVEEVPIFIAGGIGKGAVGASFLELGASGIQMGTIFVCASESIAHNNFKNAFIKANARDAQVASSIDPTFKVIPVRALSNKGMIEFNQHQQSIINKYKNNQLSQQEAQLEIERYWVGALRRAVIDGDVERGSVMAGQSVSFVKEIKPTKEIINDFITQAENHLSKLK